MAGILRKIKERKARAAAAQLHSISELRQHCATMNKDDAETVIRNLGRYVGDAHIGKRNRGEITVSQDVPDEGLSVEA